MRKSYAANYKGKPLGNLWTDIPNVTSGAERTGYPTQKPLALLERIIAASSDPGDIVLDPFCGCATTFVAAVAIPDEVWGILNASGADCRMSEAECDAVVDELMVAAEEHLPKIATQHSPQVLV